MVMHSESTFSVSGLNTLSVRVRVLSLPGSCPFWVVSLSGLCHCPVMSVQVASCPITYYLGCAPARVLSCPGYVPVRVVSCPDCVLSR